MEQLIIFCNLPWVPIVNTHLWVLSSHTVKDTNKISPSICCHLLGLTICHFYWRKIWDGTILQELYLKYTIVTPQKNGYIKMSMDCATQVFDNAINLLNITWWTFSFYGANFGFFQCLWLPVMRKKIFVFFYNFGTEAGIFVG